MGIAAILEKRYSHTWLNLQVTDGNNMLHMLLIYLPIIVYLVIAYFFFTEWLNFFLQDEEMNSEQRSFSGVILVLASILWVIVVPFAYLELLKFHKKHKQVIDLLITLSVTSICDE